MSILFIILKIIGILLLVILLLALLILFHPVYYKIKAEVEEEVAVKGYIWWLFHILRLEFEIDDSKREVWLRIFGFKKELQLGTEDEDASEGEADEQSAESDNVESVEQSQIEETGNAETIEQTEKSQSVERQKFAKIDKEKHAEQSRATRMDTEAAKGNKARGESTSKFSELKNKYEDFKTFTKFLKTEISDERNRKAVSHVWQEFLYLLRHLKPKYMKGDISFSTGDPATTGEVTGVLSMFPIVYRYDARIYPDFLSEEMYVKGSLALKGHMALFHVIAILIRGIKDKNIKRLAGKIRRFSNGR